MDWALGLRLWSRLSQCVRGITLSLSREDFVLTARAVGVSSLRILWRHLLPNAAGMVGRRCH